MSVLDAKANTTIAFTDGACKGNPGAGGWGAYLVFADGQTQAWCGGAPETTNNRMELMGAIEALKNSPAAMTIEIWTDSSYVKNGITQWIDNWKKKGWKTANKKPVANQDLWQQLDELRTSRSVSWHWVKGHAGHAGNEKADELANLGVERVLKGLTEAFQSQAAASISALENEQTVESTVLPHQPQANLTDDSTNPKKQMLDQPTLDNSASLKKNLTLLDDDSALQSDWIDNDPLGYDCLNDNIEHIDDIAELFDHREVEPSPSIRADNTVNQSTDVISQTLTGYDRDTESFKPTHDTPHTMMPTMTANTTDAPDSNSSNITATEDTSNSFVAFDGDTSRVNPHFIPLLPDPIHKGLSDRQLIMDTETTGLDAMKGDRIIEVGIVELIGRRFTGEKLHVYINPERSMDEDAIRIHGISEAFLQDKPKFAEVAQKLFDFMAGAEVIAHNAPFDMSFLTMEFDKVGLKGFAESVQVTDSLVMAKQQYPGQRNTLDALVRRLNVGKQDRTFHGALLDAEILAEVYLAMTGGQVALAIDEDSQHEGNGTHAQFHQLAAKLIAAPIDTSDHESWLAQLSKEYPALLTVWGG
ncbi:MAG: DNA polymerase III subunit epsilon [Psychrobacter sp.]|nr:DNA polymerase III subunit epsilon [Psychrobacter sp.]